MRSGQSPAYWNLVSAESKPKTIKARQLARFWQEDDLMDAFEDVLDRLDVTFEDLGDLQVNLEKLLGRPASDLQMDIATAKLSNDLGLATFEGLRVTTFERGGRTITQLRDRRGRFVATGGRGITSYLRRDFA
jgi:hypothetical protein